VRWRLVFEPGLFRSLTIRKKQSASTPHDERGVGAGL
jgi:hypothetical protein